MRQNESYWTRHGMLADLAAASGVSRAHTSAVFLRKSQCGYRTAVKLRRGAAILRLRIPLSALLENMATSHPAFAKE